jgi:hypothetical protein
MNRIEYLARCHCGALTARYGEWSIPGADWRGRCRGTSRTAIDISSN